MSTPIPPLSVDTAAEIARSTPGIANTEPGFANTYRAGADSPGGILMASLPALGVGGLGALLLYHRHLQDKRKKEKQASLEGITAQLPGLHAKDMLLGAALGGGAGLAYDALASKPTGEKRLPKALKRILGGAAIGAAGANLVGDRARRYITNTQLPAGYTPGSILPTSFKQFWDGAILDKPSFDPKSVQAQADLQPGNKGYAEISQTIINARRELLRRAFGVHSNSKADIWQKNKGNAGPDYYSLNESRKDYPALVKQLFLPSSVEAGEYHGGGVFANPRAAFPNTSADNNQWGGTDILGENTLVGGQQISLRETPGMFTHKFKGRTLDRFDVTPSKKEVADFKDAILTGKIFDSKWMKQPRQGDGYLTATGKTNSTFVKSMLRRLVVDKLLTEEHPWVSQSFNMTPTPVRSLSDRYKRLAGPSNAPKYDLQLTRESGKPATESMSHQDLMNYLMALREGKVDSVDK
jgi:hypothetical protein